MTPNTTKTQNVPQRSVGDHLANNKTLISYGPSPPYNPPVFTPLTVTSFPHCIGPSTKHGLRRSNFAF